MNTNKNEAEKLPEDVELLLPWHAAGTLSRRDAARVEQALANDNELAARYELVREELGEAIRLNETLGAPSSRAMQQLFAKIDAEPARAPKSSFNLGAWLTEFVASFRPRTLAYAASAAALAIVLQAGILTGVFVKDGGVGFTTALSSSSDIALFDTRSLNKPPLPGPPAMVALLSARNLVISAALACGLNRTAT